MINYKELYLTMFRASEQARRILLEEKLSYETAYRAVKIIQDAQFECEDMYILATENLNIEKAEV